MGGNKAKDCVQSPDAQSLVGRDWNSLVPGLLGLKNNVTPGLANFAVCPAFAKHVRKFASAQVTRTFHLVDRTSLWTKRSRIHCGFGPSKK
jgi:hypothetical protein